MRLLRETGVVILVVCVTLVAALPLVYLANLGAEAYLRANPEILMSRAERINENTRSVREAMIPRDKIAEWYDLDSPNDLKPMWDEFYSANVVFQSYVHYRSEALAGVYYGTTDPGFRMVADQGPWPPEDGNFNVFFFGGSTSFGVGPYWATVASYLQGTLDGEAAFGRPVRVYNFGRSGYHSNQEQLLLHRLISAGFVPDAVVFLDGLNDFCFRDGQPSGWNSLAAFVSETNERARARAAGHGVHTDWSALGDFIGNLPLLRLLNATFSAASEEPLPQYTGPEGAVAEPSPPRAELEAVLDRYVANMSQVQAVGNGLGFSTLFVWQPIPTYEYDPALHLFYPDRLGCHVGSKFGYPLMAERVEAGLPLRNFLWAADLQKSARENLYIDAFHYTAPFSRTIAALIAEKMIQIQSDTASAAREAN